jgi:hypothetical protein
LVVAATWNIVDVRLTRAGQVVPESELRLNLGKDAIVSLTQRHQDWVACCRWIEQNTEQDATFLTPRTQQTFLWYAQRAEVVNWKNCPQDARGVVQWLKRYEYVYPDPTGLKIMYGPEADLALPDEERLQLAESTSQLHDRPLRCDCAADAPRVYPVGDNLNVSYAVYRVLNDDGVELRIEQADFRERLARPPSQSASLRFSTARVSYGRHWPSGGCGTGRCSPVPSTRRMERDAHGSTTHLSAHGQVSFRADQPAIAEQAALRKARPAGVCR